MGVFEEVVEGVVRCRQRFIESRRSVKHIYVIVQVGGANGIRSEGHNSFK